MSSPIAKYLDKLIDEAPEGVVEVQLLFTPGVKMQAGAVRRCGDFEGLYEFCTPVQANEDMEDGTKAGQMVLVNIVFDPAAVLQVITTLKTSGIIQPRMVS